VGTQRGKTASCAWREDAGLRRRGYRLQVIGCGLRVTGCGLQAAGCVAGDSEMLTVRSLETNRLIYFHEAMKGTSTKRAVDVAID
jgi:hypothetical protein